MLGDVSTAGCLSMRRLGEITRILNCVMCDFVKSPYHHRLGPASQTRCWGIVWLVAQCLLFGRVPAVKVDRWRLTSPGGEPSVARGFIEATGPRIEAPPGQPIGTLE